jgi:hypothetical protein
MIDIFSRAEALLEDKRPVIGRASSQTDTSDWKVEIKEANGLYYISLQSKKDKALRYNMSHRFFKIKSLEDAKKIGEFLKSITHNQISNQKHARLLSDFVRALKKDK